MHPSIKLDNLSQSFSFRQELLVSAASTSLSAGAAMEDPSNATRRELVRLAVDVADAGDGEFILKVTVEEGKTSSRGQNKQIFFFSARIVLSCNSRNS